MPRDRHAALWTYACLAVATAGPPLEAAPQNRSAVEPLRVLNLSASEVAVYVLATTQSQALARAATGAARYDYVAERLLAGAETWGAAFPRG